MSSRASRITSARHSDEYPWLLNRRVEFTVTRQMRQGGSSATSTGVNVPTENNVPKDSVGAPAPAAPAPAGVDGERESATPPPEAGRPDAASKKPGQKSGGESK